MKRSEAEKLLGGYATGTLTADERNALFTAALGQQAIFDALMDEEALRELLADPEAKAHLLAALASPATLKIIPFWRRTGVLGAAASMIVAATAGLAYLRSPNAMPSVVRSETVKEPAAKAVEAPATKAADAPAAKAAEAPAAAHAPAEASRKAAPVLPARDADQPRQEALATSAPAPAPKALALPSAHAAVAEEDSARLREKADFRRAEVRDQLDKKAEASPAAAEAVAIVAAKRSDARERKAVTQDKPAGGLPSASGSVIGGVVGGVVGGVMGGAAPASPSSTVAKAKAAGGLATNAVATPAPPTWALEAQPDGRTRVTVSAPRGQPVTLLRRSAAGVEVLPLRVLGDRGQALLQWRTEVGLAAGDVLDLYLLNAPVAEPANLPETGPVDGFRVRIYPASK
jgi:hypothetical protein